jgi:hypothetical protein
MKKEQITQIENIMNQFDGFLNHEPKQYDGRIEDIRGAWPYLKSHIYNLIADVETPWWLRWVWLFRRWRT